MNVLNKAEIHNIFQEIKNGNKEAIEELYAKYQKLVIKISFSIVKDDDDAKANIFAISGIKEPLSCNVVFETNGGSSIASKK